MKPGPNDVTPDGFFDVGEKRPSLSNWKPFLVSLVGARGLEQDDVA